MPALRSIIRRSWIGSVFRRARDGIFRRIPLNSMLHARLLGNLEREYAMGAIRVVYDIGAHKGRWACALKSRMPGARVILFEANSAHEADLKSTGLEYHMGVLSKPGVEQVDFYSPAGPAGSTGGSYYKEVTPLFDSIRAVSTPATTLDAIVKAGHLPLPDLIKIDTQGSELDVIEGGILVFPKAKWILMELPIIPYNAGAPDTGAYLKKMDEMGFVPIELCEAHRFGTVLIQMDVLFLNKSNLDSNILDNLRL